MRTFQAVGNASSLPGYNAVESMPSSPHQGADPTASYSFVGNGLGSYEKVQDVKVTRWRLRKEWVTVVLIAFFVGVAASCALVVTRVPFSMGGAAQVRRSTGPSLGQTSPVADLGPPPVDFSPQFVVPDSAPLRVATLVSPTASVAQAGASVAQPLPYNCLEGLSDALTSWPKAKRDWCCEHQQRGCPLPLYSCSRDLSYGVASGDDDVALWPKAKREWCCTNHKVACPATTTATSTSSSTIQTTSTVTTTVRASTPEGFDCTDDKGTSLAWPTEKKVWCCKHVGTGCRGMSLSAEDTADIWAGVRAAQIEEATAKNAELNREATAAMDEVKLASAVAAIAASQTVVPISTSQAPVGQEEQDVQTMFYEFDCDESKKATWSKEEADYCWWLFDEQESKWAQKHLRKAKK